MNILRKYTKGVAAFLMLNFLVSIFLPSVSYALTGGPTAPEATSFEPIDATDMINLKTGDLVYNIPLLEVPGPSGGYPLSLSYHAGIMPNEEASWVGLGWTLNPGAITRTVHGFPDDQYGAQRKVTDDWEGGSRHTFTAGVGLPFGSVNISVSEDTYQGTGIGWNASLGAKVRREHGAKGMMVGIEAGLDGYGNNYFRPTIEAEILGISAGVSTNFKSVKASVESGGASVSYDTNGSLGVGVGVMDASISSNGLGVSMSHEGQSLKINNSNSGRIQTASFGFTIPIPLGQSGLFLNLGYNYLRYWSNEQTEVNVFGSLYSDWHDPEENSFDSFALLDADINYAKNNEPKKVLGGSMSSFDHYNVNAQGLGGNIRPYALEMQELYSQNVKKFDSDDYLVEYYNSNSVTEKAKLQFRFIGDLSNSYHYAKSLSDKPRISSHGEEGTNFLGRIADYGENGAADQIDGFEEDTYQLAGSRDIEWISNEEVKAGYDGLILPKSFSEWEVSKFGYDISKQIGAYIITNTSGVKYHYSQPVYTYHEVIHTSKVDDEDGERTNIREHPEPYAYTWYLTAVTGPDYLDKNGDGMLNEGDWGYWVKFDYGKWTDQFIWRNPGVGTHKDIDETFESYSSGIKELYYLNSIKTKTHTALFLKEVREDGKGIAVPDSFLHKKMEKDIYVSNMDDLENGFQPEEVDFEYTYGYLTTKIDGLSPSEATFITKPKQDCGNLSESACNKLQKVRSCTKSYKGVLKPVSPLKLSKIFLLKNEDLSSYLMLEEVPNLFANNDQLSSGSNIDFLGSSGDDGVCDFDGDLEQHSLALLEPETFFDRPLHYGENVFDSKDLEGLTNDLSSVVLREIDFVTDYSLCPETTNSFANDNLYDNYQKSAEQRELGGKLTLNSLAFNGKKGARIIPPMEFSYDIPVIITQETVDFMFGDKIGIISNPDGLFLEDIEVGDLIKFVQNNKWYYGLITYSGFGFIDPDSGISTQIQFSLLLNETGTDGIVSNLQKTKNPPFDKDAVDMWGMYKSDYLDTNNEAFDRLVTDVSAQGADSWSLRKIKSNLGAEIKIEYSRDEYVKPELYKQNLLSLTDIIAKDDELVLMTASSLDQIASQLKENGLELMTLMHQYFYSNYSQGLIKACDGTDMGVPFGAYFGTFLHTHELSIESSDILEITNNSITINNPVLYALMADDSETYFNYTEGDCIDVGGTNFDPEAKLVNKQVFLQGNILFKGGAQTLGGGLRVDEITVIDPLQNEESSTQFTYGDGVTSFEPLGLGVVDMDNLDYRRDPETTAYSNWSAQIKRMDDAEDDFKNSVYNYFSNLMAVSQVIPAPGVIYGDVKVKSYSKGVKLKGHVEYKYQTFQDDMIKRETVSSIDGDTGYPAKSLAFMDHSASLGSMLSVTQYDERGNKLKKTTNEYLKTFSDEIIDAITGQKAIDIFYSNFENQGLISELFLERRIAEVEVDDEDVIRNQAIMTLKEQFPSIQLGTTVIDYKKNVTTITENLAFDFYSGALTKSRSWDGNGNVFESESVPAYRVTRSDDTRPYSEMGLGLNGGKNMLTQVAENYVYKVNPDNYNREALMSSNIQTWEKNWSYRSITSVASTRSADGFPTWRKHKSYSFIGDGSSLESDGTYAYTSESHPSFDAWRYTDDEIGDGGPWQKNSEITLYDRYSHALEVTDLNGDYAATKMDSNQEKVLSTAANASYDEMVFSGAEDDLRVVANVDKYFGGGVGLGTGTIYTSTGDGTNDALVHTGKSSIKANNDQSAFEYTLTAQETRKVKVSVWSNRDDGSLRVGNNDLTIEKIRQSGENGWYLLSGTLIVDAANQYEFSVRSNSNNTYFDDFRVHPVNAAMTSYVYNDWDELTHVLDANNLYTKYEYDDMGRLSATYRESFKYGEKKISSHGIHYSERPSSNQ